MTDIIATLGMAVDSRDVTKADKELKKLEKTGSKTEKTTNTMTAGFKRLAVQLAAIVSVTAGARKLVSVAREFDVINASLETVTGSSEAAQEAFLGIQAFAKETPFSLQQVSEAFIKLSALGLEPSREALISYGNTASAMGKDLSQMIEAVADAATGEFERLKEFGIKASTQGDQVSFTFRGVTTTVQKNSAEITKYLREIGDEDFAGAMEKRANTLDGALSNLGDSWDQLFLSITQQGIGDSIESGVRMAIDALDELETYIASGAMDHQIAAIAVEFNYMGENVTRIMNQLTRVINGSANEWRTDGQDAASFFIDAFANIVPNVTTTFKLLENELATLTLKAASTAAVLKSAIDKAFRGEGVDIAATGALIKNNLDNISAARLNIVELILKEHEETIKLRDANRKAAQEAYDAEIQLRSARTGELPISHVEGAGAAGETDAERKAREKLEAAIIKTKDALVDWIDRAEYELTLSGLSTEQREKAIKLWELERAGVDLTSEAYADLNARLGEVYDQREAQRLYIEEQEKLADQQQEIWDNTIGQLQEHFSDNFFDIMQGNFDNLGDAFKSMLDRMIADALSAQLTQALFGTSGSPTDLGGLATGLFGGLFGTGSSSGSSGGTVLSYEQAVSGLYAKGGVFTNSVVSQPTAFKFADGTGIMGESGPEAIMPLSRGANGELGVKAAGGGQSVTMNFMVQGNTDRRSQQQIADAAFQGMQRATARNG